MSARGRLGALVAVFGVVGLAGGCTRDKPTQRFTPTVLGARDIARQPPGSPQRAFFELVRALEYSDHARAATYLGPSWHLSGAELAKRFSPIPLVGLGIPQIRSLRIRGDRARFSVTLGPQRARIVMRRRAGAWTVSSAALG